MPPEAESLPLYLRGPVRLRILTTLRWLAVAGQTAAILLVHFGFGFPTPLGLTLGVIAASVWLNLFAQLRYSPQRILSDREAAAYLAFDIVQLCVLLFLTGGLQNPFAVLILAPVTIAASILPLRLTVLIGALAFAGISVIGVWHLPLPWREGVRIELPEMYVAGFWVALLVSVAFFANYAHRIAEESARMETALAATQLALAREERLAALGGLAAAAAHELGTPLATIQVTATEMASELKGQDVLEEDARLLVAQARRCREILSRLSERGETGDSILDRVALDALLREAAQPFLDDGKGPAVIFEMLGEGPAPVLRRRAEIVYGLRNLIENAVAFARSKVLVIGQWSPEATSVHIHDDGPGFAPDIIGRLGEPYLGQRRVWRDATRRTGLGLGFFIAKTLLERTGAKISFANAPWRDGSGTTGAFVSATWPTLTVAALGGA
jgi:two-component system sensor histidine kinase RegB